MSVAAPPLAVEQHAIEVAALTKRFGDFAAVDGVSFTVEKGEIFGLLGPNGAGKTTLIRMLCTLLRPTAGGGTVSGCDVRSQASRVREHIGLVTEKIILYDRLTAAENLLLFGRLHHIPDRLIKERSERWLELLQMQEWRDRKVGHFSTGMKQRINLARALLPQPDVLFLDEPTLGLDPQTSRAIRDFIRGLSGEGITIMLTTHIMLDADTLCRRVGIMDRGRIAALDTPANLKRLIADGETTVLDLGLAGEGDGVAAMLGELEGVTSVSCLEEGRWRVHGKGKGTLERVLEALRSAGVGIRSIASMEPTLEDVFLRLTGREMRDGANEKMPPHHRHGPFQSRPRVR